MVIDAAVSTTLAMHSDRGWEIALLANLPGSVAWGFVAIVGLILKVVLHVPIPDVVLVAAVFLVVSINQVSMVVFGCRVCRRICGRLSGRAAA